MAIPTYDEQRGPAQTVQAPQGADYMGIRPASPDAVIGALQGFQDRMFERREQAVQQQAAERGAIEQTQRGPGELAQAPDVAERYQAAFRERAREVQGQQMQRDARRKALELRQQHRFDPEGFNAAFNEYREGALRRVRHDDPGQAAALDEMLQEIGSGASNQIAEQAFQREESRLTHETLDTLRASVGDFQQALLNDPSEELYDDLLGAARMDLEQAVESGRVSPEQAARERRQIENSLTGEYVRGKFNRYLQNEDPEGAESIIEQLKKGRWFEDNEHDRQLAGQLARELEQQAGGADIDAASHVERLRQMTSAAKEGAPVDEEAIDQALQVVELHGTDRQIQDARGRVQGAYMLGQAQRDLHSMPYTEIQGYVDGLQSQIAEMAQAGEMPEEMQNELRGLVEKHQERVRKAYSEGSPLLVTEKMPWRDMTSEEGLQRLHERRARAAQVMDLNPEAIGYHRPEEKQEIVDAFEQSRQTGDMQGADDALTAYMMPYLQESPRRQAAAALSLGDYGGEMYAAAALTTFGGVDTVTDLLSLSRDGENIDHLEDNDRQYVDTHWERDRGRVGDQISALALGDPALRDQMTKTAENVYRGEFVRAIDQGESRMQAAASARDRLKRTFDPVGDPVELDNGVRVPKQFLSRDPNPDMADAIVDEINAQIEQVREAERRGEGWPGEADNIVPMPAEDGSIVLHNRTMNRPMQRPDGQGYLKIDREELIRETGIDPDAEPEAGFFARLQESTSEFFNRRAESRETDDAQALARQMGVDEALVKAIHDAGRSTVQNNELPYDRRGNFAVPAGEEDQTDWERLQQMTPPRAGDRERWQRDASDRRSEIPIAVDRLRRMQERFEGDETAAVAAYFTDEDTVQELQSSYGENWMDELSDERLMMVERALRRLNKLRE